VDFWWQHLLGAATFLCLNANVIDMSINEIFNFEKIWGCTRLAAMLVYYEQDN